MSWEVVNNNLIAKTIGELTYEQILKPHMLSENFYVLKLKNGAEYYFMAWSGIWDHLRVDPTSIKKSGALTVSAGQFFVDAQIDLDMNDIVLSNFIEEMHNSLYSEMALHEKQKDISTLEMSEWDGEKIQAFLNGHPKILLGHGRVGWGSRDFQDYAPENEPSFTLHWLAVKKDLKELSVNTSYNSEYLLQESMDENELTRFKESLTKKNVDFDDHYYLPVHPWQWDRFVKIQYQEMLAQNKLISIGQFGDKYTPQISLRTLSNTSRPKRLDIKLPLSILNTSAIRGIPARYIGIGADLSQYLLDLCQQDELLRDSKTDILSEVSGMSIQHTVYTQIEKAAYRYQEFLGAIWRESSLSKALEHEHAVLTGSLFFQDLKGHSLIGAYIKKSGLETTEWLKQYFKVVVIPLYHLQLKYGVGLVAHGQNIILRMKNFRPYGIILKDFQGDLRLADNSRLLERADFKAIASKLDKLPANYLIHDLLTGHMVTVLRFVSEVMEESDHFKEIEFYQILSSVIAEYEATHLVPQELSFLNAEIHRVLVNKVRFKIGHGDTSERPKPMLGEDLQNPIYLGKKYGEECYE